MSDKLKWQFVKDEATKLVSIYLVHRNEKSSYRFKFPKEFTFEENDALHDFASYKGNKMRFLLGPAFTLFEYECNNGKIEKEWI